MSAADVLIVGGGAMGAGVAWMLKGEMRHPGRVVVVERDPSYARAASTLTNSCIRQQFTTPINIRLSRATLDYIANFPARMGGDAPAIATRFFGYLYLAGNEAHAARLREAQALQASLGAATRLMSPAEIAAEWPFYDLDGIVLGSFGAEREGWFDGAAMVEAWRRLSRRAGAEWIAGEVAGLDVSAGRVTAAILADGTRIPCGTVVNAAGTRAPALAAMAGGALPVEPRRRFTWVLRAAEPLPRDLPLTIDPSGVHVRTDGAAYMAGCAPGLDPAMDPADFADDEEIWEDRAWPAIAARIPAFERVRVTSLWVGHYDYNTIDQNAIIGPLPEAPNMLVMSGFSGHGLQHAAPCARAVAELVHHGAYSSLDLSPLGFARLAAPAAREAAVI